MISITDQKGKTLLNTDLRNSSQNEMKFEQAFYFGQQFIQFSSYLDFTDSLLYGLKAFNSSDRSTRQAFGLFLLTTNPAEIITIPESERLIFRIMGDGIFSLYVYAGPTVRDVV